MLLIFFSDGNCQEPEVNTDSLKLYRDIESFSSKRKFTKFMHHIVFKSTPKRTTTKKVKKKPNNRPVQKPYSAFEGKIIRYIGIETLDPFGYSITDTIVSNQNTFTAGGNKMHIKTQRAAIRNLLIIKKNQIFDSLRVKESERLIRSQPYVRDVAFYVVLASKNSDSVDIFIRELDKWSLIPKFSYSSSVARFQLNDRNFMGLGHEFKNAYSWYHTSGSDAYIASYMIPNILSTYISTTFKYGTDEYGYFTRGVSIDRPFYSQFTQWAAGVNLSKINRRDSLLYNDTLTIAKGIDFNTYDYWAGHAIRIFRGSSENERTTNFIYALRYTQIHYLKFPEEGQDPYHTYSNQKIYMSSIGISTRKYVRDKYIFKFGITEDVPIGKVFSITGGYRERLNSGQVYLGARVAFGNYFSWGYFGTNYEYGTFFSGTRSRQGVFFASANYFTGLYQVGKWRIRQFIKPELTLGLNRNASDSITIKDGFGIDGFNSTGLSGTNRILVAFQTQVYAPWNLLGFRFGPYFNFSMGMLGDANAGFSKSRLYSQIGLGVLVKNENLVIETFQFSVSFYPIIPGVGNSIFKVNSIKSTDFGYRDFEIGKPQIVPFE